MKIKKGDNVIVITGKDRGRQGKVSRVLPKLDKVIVEGVSLQKRRERPRQQGKKGQTVEISSPISSSNAMLYCASCKKGVRTGVKLSAKQKLRICRSCSKEI